MNYNSECCPFTLNTTRICGINEIDTAIQVSKVGFTYMKPNAVILVNRNEVCDGIAATSLVHFPINAALLFTERDYLQKEVLTEIQRLSPKGYKGVHVILVGNISKNIATELNSYGFKTCNIKGQNHYETACKISRVRKEFKNILIMSGENYSEGIISGYWAAHHGDPILYVEKNAIPDCTLEVIKKMKNIDIYIIGSECTVSEEVKNYLCKLKNVKNINRIGGETPYEIAVNFARYKNSNTEFGWGRNYRDGHAFSFGELYRPMEIIAGVLLAHMGKHTPLLLIKRNNIPKIVEQYIKSVKPMQSDNMPRPPFMHGFILGDTNTINYEAQLMVEELISIDHEAGEMGNMNEMTSIYGKKIMMGMESGMHGSSNMNMSNMHSENYKMEMKDDYCPSGGYINKEQNGEKICNCNMNTGRNGLSLIDNYQKVNIKNLID